MSSVPEASTSGQKGFSEKRVSSERCAELTIIAATHGLKEVWISYQDTIAASLGSTLVKRQIWVQSLYLQLCTWCSTCQPLAFGLWTRYYLCSHH
ncbi:uncharacterized protein LOC114264786 isoform X3 [Camellia sinensis]|uniref:uncharacterized protein LOC114264786 isoform X3 n=1 Tax=Camellia sinensis TaxID=4442 RepID=UPI001036AC72|nr:uncharacterized protein LOC114264786 isoform X3 [Camellia sinensis]